MSKYSNSRHVIEQYLLSLESIQFQVHSSDTVSLQLNDDRVETLSLLYLIKWSKPRVEGLGRNLHKKRLDRPAIG